MDRVGSAEDGEAQGLTAGRGKVCALPFRSQQAAAPLDPSADKGNVMPKGRQKSNKEVKKAKKEKPSAAPAGSLEKGLNPSNDPPKKKG